MKTTVTNKRRGNPTPRDVYVGRPGPWGNPYRLANPHDDRQRQAVLAKYRLWLTRQVETGRLPLTRLKTLTGKRLVCWCAPKPCHGDVLAQAADWAAANPEPTAKAAWKA